MDKKTCSKCGVEKFLGEYYFQKSNKDSLSCWCKECCNEYNKQNKYKYKENKIEYSKKYYNMNKNKIKEYNIKYYKENKEYHNKYKKKYAEENKEAIKVRIKKYYEENKLIRKEKSKQYYYKNKEKLKERRNQYVEKNRSSFNIYAGRRNSKKKQLPSTFTVNQWDRCKEYFNNKCAYCGEKKPLAQDHFMPLSKGGGYTKENIIPACKSCNSSKSNKLFNEWYIKQPYYSKERELKILEYLVS